jgi:hypothetical protein
MRCRVLPGGSALDVPLSFWRPFAAADEPEEEVDT